MLAVHGHDANAPFRQASPDITEVLGQRLGNGCDSKISSKAQCAYGSVLTILVQERHARVKV